MLLRSEEDDDRKKALNFQCCRVLNGVHLGTFIPYDLVLLSDGLPEKPTKKNKVPDPIKADVICDMGASVSLAPLSIA